MQTRKRLRRLTKQFARLTAMLTLGCCLAAAACGVLTIWRPTAGIVACALLVIAVPLWTITIVLQCGAIATELCGWRRDRDEESSLLLRKNVN
jgi:hypothetical protein